VAASRVPRRRTLYGPLTAGTGILKTAKTLGEHDDGAARQRGDDERCLIKALGERIAHSQRTPGCGVAAAAI
jgi:hypothetical protein